MLFRSLSLVQPPEPGPQAHHWAGRRGTAACQGPLHWSLCPQRAGWGPTGGHLPQGMGRASEARVSGGPRAQSLRTDRAGACLHPRPQRRPPSTHIADSQRLAAGGPAVPDGQRRQVVAVDVDPRGRTACGTEGATSAQVKLGGGLVQAGEGAGEQAGGREAVHAAAATYAG